MPLADLRPQATRRAPGELLGQLRSFNLDLKFSAGIWYFSPAASRFHAKYSPDLTIEQRLDIAAGVIKSAKLKGVQPAVIGIDKWVLVGFWDPDGGGFSVAQWTDEISRCTNLLTKPFVANEPPFSIGSGPGWRRTSWRPTRTANSGWRSKRRSRRSPWGRDAPVPTAAESFGARAGRRPAACGMHRAIRTPCDAAAHRRRARN